jgi:hypothetical protein
VFPHPLLGQGARHEAMTRHPPRPLPAPRGERDLVTRDAQGKQMPSAGARPFPLFPGAQPDSSSEPWVQLDHFCIAAAVAEVLEPARDGALERCKAGGHAPPIAPCGALTDPLLEPLDGGRRPRQRPASHLEAEQGTRAEGRRLALARVDPQAYTPLDEPADTAYYPLSRPLTAHEDQEVLGIPRPSQGVGSRRPSGRMTPARPERPLRRSTRRSAIRRARRCINTPWCTVAKKLCRSQSAPKRRPSP